MSPETFQEKVGSTLQKLAPDLQKQVLFQKNITQFLTNYKTPWFQEILDLSFQYTKNAFDTSLFDEPQALINVMFATEDNLKQQILKLSEVKSFITALLKFLTRVQSAYSEAEFDYLRRRFQCKYLGFSTIGERDAKHLP